jgi:hypothetical protein
MPDQQVRRVLRPIALHSLPERPRSAPADARSADILYFAADNITAAEADSILALDLERIELAKVREDPFGAARRAVAWGARYERLLIHLDVDVLSFTDFPIPENVRRCDLVCCPRDRAARHPADGNFLLQCCPPVGGLPLGGCGGAHRRKISLASRAV